MQLTGGKIGYRLLAEAETNLAINVIPGMSESFEVQGRGELQLGLCFSNFSSIFLHLKRWIYNMKHVRKHATVSFCQVN